nr:hypothetical protein Q903MT_gene54 [Picea sitchensis]
MVLLMNRVGRKALEYVGSQYDRATTWISFPEGFEPLFQILRKEESRSTYIPQKDIWHLSLSTMPWFSMDQPLSKHSNQQAHKQAHAFLH